MAIMTLTRKPTQPRIRFELEKLNDPLVVNAFPTTIGGRFAPLTMLVDRDVELDSIVTKFNRNSYRISRPTTTEVMMKFLVVVSKCES